MTFSRRVGLLATDSDRVVFQLHWARVREMIASGVVVVESKTKQGTVTTVRLTGKATAIDARPGSLGIRVEQLVNGHIYQHKATYERALGLAA